jgi:cytochrome c
VNINAVSKLGLVAGLTAGSLLLASQALAEDRSDVLERIAPVGKVAVEGKTAPATPAAAQAPAEAASAETAPAEPAQAEQTAAAEPAAAPASAGGDQLALATSSGCMACHQVDVKVVGPAYKDVAAKYKGDAGALDQLAAKVKAGGVGVWGQIPMPPNVQVSDENIRTIVTWVLSL